MGESVSGNSTGLIKALHVQKALIWLERHHAHHELGLDDLALHLGLSRCYVSRLFETVTGKGFRTHLRQSRMAHARELLQMTNSTVKEIAWKVGYCHASNFARDFKAEYRETPVTVRVSFQLEVKRATS